MIYYNIYLYKSQAKNERLVSTRKRVECIRDANTFYPVKWADFPLLSHRLKYYFSLYLQ